MLELLRNLGIIGKEWIYFVCKKDINFGEPGVECYVMNVWVPS